MLKDTTAKKPANIMSLRSRDIPIADNRTSKRAEARKINKSPSVSSITTPKSIRSTRLSKDSGSKLSYKSEYGTTPTLQKSQEQPRKKLRSRTSSYERKPKIIDKESKTPGSTRKLKLDKSIQRTSSLTRKKEVQSKSKNTPSLSKKRSNSRMSRSQVDGLRIMNRVQNTPKSFMNTTTVPNHQVSVHNKIKERSLKKIGQSSRAISPPRLHAKILLHRYEADSTNSVGSSEIRIKKTKILDEKENDNVAAVDKIQQQQTNDDVDIEHGTLEFLLLSLRVFIAFIVSAIMVALFLGCYFILEKKPAYFTFLKNFFSSNL